MFKGEKVNWMKFKMITMIKVRKMTMLLMRMRSLKILRGNLDWCFVKLIFRILYCFILIIDCSKKGRYCICIKNRNLYFYNCKLRQKLQLYNLRFIFEIIVRYVVIMKFQ